MKTKNFLKNKMQTAAVCLFAATMTVNFSACTDDLDNMETEESQPEFTGFGAAADNFNINDGEFTADNWREHEAIYLYDGIGQDATDIHGRQGYTLVNLPWHQGDVQTNLPNGFCKDITSENGWELVLNRCGSRSIKNNNFIALYNIYTGTLRFFYQPEKFQTGNDHVWEVKMTDNLAQNSTLRYSVPQDRSIKHKDEIGQTTIDNTIVEYIAPWVGSLSQDGLITPNAGWWAFDVDLWLYSGKSLDADDNIALQMRSWDMSHVSLSSLLTASIDGSIKANVDLMQSQHLSNSVMGMVAKAGSIGGNVYKMATALETMQWGTAIGQGIEMGKSVANMCGIKTESAQDIQGTIDGTLSLTMTGNIETAGTIEAAKPTQGIASPTLFLKDFDRTKATAMGEGIWNLSQSPVVYYTDVMVDYKSEEQHTTKVWTRPVLSDKKATFWDYMKYAAKKSPFDGVDNSKNPCRGRLCYFDPTNIKVVLNEKVFNADEIKNAKVFATCGVRKNARFGSTEGYRKAMELHESLIEGTANREYVNHPFDAIPFDALNSHDDKMGKKTTVKFAIEDFKNGKYAVFGRGDADYLIEPQVLHSGEGDDYMPAYEVNVTLVVEHNGKSLVYNRTHHHRAKLSRQLCA